MSSKKLNIVSYDYDELNSNFIEFIKTFNTEFSDIDYEGSNIALLNSILNRNTQLTGYAANFVATESFLKTAQLRKNVVAEAGLVSYVPRSKTSSLAVVDVVVTPSSTIDIPTIIEASKGLTFISSVGGESVYFTNEDSFTLTLVNGVYVASDITIREGELTSLDFVYNTSEGSITILDKDIDTSTLRVYIDNSDSDVSDTEYTRALTIKDITKSSYTYFLFQNDDENYYVEFGKNTFGIEPPDSSIIKVEFISASTVTSNVNKFSCASTISGYSNIGITTTTPSYGGGEQETIDSIRFLAPLSYQSQERLVNSNDSIELIRSKYPFIKSVRSWGGEKNNPPKYGNIMICMITNDGSLLSPYIKEQMINYLDEYGVGSITPIIVDPTYVYLDPTISIKFDRNITTKSFTSIKLLINNIIDEYNIEITDFNGFYNTSEVIKRIKNLDGIVSSYVENSLKQDVEIVRSSTYVYNLSYGNAITDFSINDFSASIIASSEKIYDVDGVIVYESIINGNTVTKNIGVINYETGTVSFSLLFINEKNTVTSKATPKNKNIYSSLEKIITIDSTTIKEVAE